jgi:formylglycine-generating enzyme required for sulfatase activity
MKRWMTFLLITAFVGVIGFTIAGCGGPEEEAAEEGLNPMILITAAGKSFLMGSPDTEQPRVEAMEQQHWVKLTENYYMGKYEVTQDLWDSVMDTNPSYHKDWEKETNTEDEQIKKKPSEKEIQGKRPVENINFYQMLVFCNTFSIKENRKPAYSIKNETDPEKWGEPPINVITEENAFWDDVTIVANSDGYRLPTEAQWEFACRAGTTTAYNNNTDWQYVIEEGGDPHKFPGWYTDNSSLDGENTGKTHQVGLKPANKWGLHDMHGNVWERCWDWREPFTENAQNNPVIDPKGPTQQPTSDDPEFRPFRVDRGGSYLSDSQKGEMRSACRVGRAPETAGVNMGFRIVRPVKK